MSWGSDVNHFQSLFSKKAQDGSMAPWKAKWWDIIHFLEVKHNRIFTKFGMPIQVVLQYDAKCIPSLTVSSTDFPFQITHFTFCEIVWKSNYPSLFWKWIYASMVSHCHHIHINHQFKPDLVMFLTFPLLQLGVPSIWVALGAWTPVYLLASLGFFYEYNVTF